MEDVEEEAKNEATATIRTDHPLVKKDMRPETPPRRLVNGAAAAEAEADLTTSSGSGRDGDVKCWIEKIERVESGGAKVGEDLDLTSGLAAGNVATREVAPAVAAVTPSQHQLPRPAASKDSPASPIRGRRQATDKPDNSDSTAVREGDYEGAGCRGKDEDDASATSAASIRHQRGGKKSHENVAPVAVALEGAGSNHGEKIDAEPPSLAKRQEMEKGAAATGTATEPPEQSQPRDDESPPPPSNCNNKRGRTAYFIFADEMRAKVSLELAEQQVRARPRLRKTLPSFLCSCLTLRAVRSFHRLLRSTGSKNPNEKKKRSVASEAKALGALWKQMSEDEKRPYHERAAVEKEEARSYESHARAGGSAAVAIGISDGTGTGNMSVGGGGSRGAASRTSAMPSPGFPPQKIRKICRLDPDVRSISREAVALVSKAAELALIKLSKESVKVAATQNRRKLLAGDAVGACHNREQFAFLREDLMDLARIQADENRKRKAERTAANAAAVKPVGAAAEDDADKTASSGNKSRGDFFLHQPVTASAASPASSFTDSTKVQVPSVSAATPKAPPSQPPSKNLLTAYFASKK
jgi:histone H3/H4